MADVAEPFPLNIKYVILISKKIKTLRNTNFKKEQTSRFQKCIVNSLNLCNKYNFFKYKLVYFELIF